MDRRTLLCILVILVHQVFGQNSTNSTDDGSFPYDPVLAHRPNFAWSLPIQILLLGITLTLTAVLIIHLVFTAQYHWPLAPVNYVLQMSAATTLLVSCIATLHVVLSSTVKQSMVWPYMLDYIAVEIPPLLENTDWAIGELAAWLLMNATTSGLIQITHIQFLTLLYPSTLERRLIFSLLGPLAIVSSAMHIVRIHDSAQLVKVASAVQNVCNATLSLLFTSSLFLWGCVINRRDAWRTDGGTAVFGAGALTLALISTALTFLYIPSRDQFAWMPALMWSVILWQSFLGWWWWVGAGMGVGEVDELLRREQKRQEKRRIRLAKRQVRKERAQTLWKGMTGALWPGKPQNAQSHPDGESSSDDSQSGEDGGEPRLRPHTDEEGDGDSLRHTDGGKGVRMRRVRTDTSSQTAVSVTGAGLSTSGTSTASSGRVSRFLNQYRAGQFVYGWYLGLRHAHLTAAREQAVERVERINQAYGPEATQETRRAVFGWGLGGFGIRRQQRSRGDGGGVGVGKDDGFEMDEFDSGEEDLRTNWGVRAEGRTGFVTGSGSDAGAGTGLSVNEGGEGMARRMESDSRHGLRDENHRPSSMWWWGPLQRWRLQDSTDYRS